MLVGTGCFHFVAPNVFARGRQTRISERKQGGKEREDPVPTYRRETAVASKTISQDKTWLRGNTLAPIYVQPPRALDEGNSTLTQSYGVEQA